MERHLPRESISGKKDGGFSPSFLSTCECWFGSQEGQKQGVESVSLEGRAFVTALPAPKAPLSGTDEQGGDEEEEELLVPPLPNYAKFSAPPTSIFQ